MAQNSDQKSNSSGSLPHDAPHVHSTWTSDILETQDKTPYSFDIGGVGYGSDAMRMQSRRGSRGRSTTIITARNRSFVKRRRILVTAVVLIAAIIVVVLVLRYSPLFEIRKIAANQTEHVSSTTISSLAVIPDGATLFNLDESKVVEKLSVNPWIARATITTTFPDQINIEIVERQELALVMLSNGTEAWRIASDAHWLEPVALQEPGSSDTVVATPIEQARAIAKSSNDIFVTEVDGSIKPTAGALCTDDGIGALITYLAEFSPELRSQIVSAKAKSREALSIVLTNGIEVLLGAPNDIIVKERVIIGLLAAHEGEITYINVRVASAPTWRGRTSEDDALAAAALAAQAEQEQRAAAEAAAAAAAADPANALVQVTEASVEEPQAVQPQDTTPAFEPQEGDTNYGYYSEYGTWIWSYFDEFGNYIYGYNDANGNWIPLG
ncbi:MAG: FtsQ-type POTRA domain-containing protein [Coriobacteriales bacterium]|nr:FtsQ-type POTRA domain-containing protein [Coriobacteriales bacterium]